MTNYGPVVEYLLSGKAIRERAQLVFDRCLEGKGSFQLNLDKLDDVSDLVIEVTKNNYPDLKIPFHSRWRHFTVGGVDRLKESSFKMEGLSSRERVYSKLDLVILSVFLDAGAGDQWSYLEDSSGKTFSRSEGLAVASFHLFKEGHFSNDPQKPLQANGEALKNLDWEVFKKGMQISEQNPLKGDRGRFELVKTLGETILNNPQYFPNGRPSGVAHSFVESEDTSFSAHELLKNCLLAFGPIWPGREVLDNIPLGDVWAHSGLKAEGKEYLIPFHKLSQWLTYSLLEPIQEIGKTVSEISLLTGLAEYRNGGLFIDGGVLVPNKEHDLDQEFPPGSDLMIEWRSLTIILLDRLYEKVREKLGLSKEEFPMVKMLEGGSWWAGRRLAQEAREGGGPPIRPLSDGTVF